VEPDPARSDVVERVQREVERSILRARNGIRFATSRANVGATPKDVVWRRDRAELWRYRGGPVRYDPPVLIVHSLVSRSYIFDLRPGSSTIEYLVDAGFDVFLLDWGIPDERDADNTLETYVDEYLPRAVAALLRETGCPELTMAGYCLGGTFAILYAAGYEDTPVRNLVLMATPVDYHQMGPMVAAVLDGRLDVDDIVDETGNVPADALYSGFFMLAPTKEIAQYATLLEHLWNDEFVDGYQAMAQWSREQVPFPGAALRQIVDDFVRNNSMMTGRVRLGGREIDFRDVPGTVLNAFAERDNVVPVEAVEPLGALVGDPARREELRLGGGHVTFAAGSYAFKHTLPTLVHWLVEHSVELEIPRERSWGSGS
jgi:poly[(R)-3-hydroxyalkanoate] polymerase subunit PhaC